MQILAKTPRGLEEVAAARIREAVGGDVTPRPGGFLGLVAIDGLENPEAALKRIYGEVPEVEYAYLILKEVDAELDAIAAAAAGVAREKFSAGETFAVRTTRRGSHSFTSVDVNIRAGAAVQDATGADVDLTNPDKILWVEIIGERAYIAVTPGKAVRRKLWPGKHPVLHFLRRISFIQLPYLGEGSNRMGVRIGRAAQAFELGELVVAPYRPVDMDELLGFLKGLAEGRDARLRVQRRTYARDVRRVPIRLYNLYQLVRERRGEPIMVTDPTGIPVGKAFREIADAFLWGGRVNVLAGAREGVPKGVFRFATVVVDLCPGVTFATEHTIPAAVEAIVASLEAEGVLSRFGD